jgi:hypothetical protein
VLMACNNNVFISLSQYFFRGHYFYKVRAFLMVYLSIHLGYTVFCDIGLNKNKLLKYHLHLKGRK